MENNPEGPYYYRIRLMLTQIEVLFGKAPESLEQMIDQSQISQAEADKYFIERMRIRRDRTGGIIWWNLLDGWPQISDAVVDYYFGKKLAYGYIRRSQTPVCMMFDEPDDEGFAALCAVNDTPHDAAITYRISDALTGETLCEAVGTAPADESRVLWRDALRSLGRPYGQVLWMRFFGGLSQQEIAGRFGVSQAQVSRWEREGRRLLRESFGEKADSLEKTRNS